MEYDKTESDLETDDGYSDAQSALDIEIQGGNWKTLGNSAFFAGYSRPQRVFMVYQAASNRLQILISAYLVAGERDNGKDDFLGELSELRMIQDILINCLLWEHSGQLEEYMVPKEVWELIK